MNTALAQHLVALLKSHGVNSTLRGADVLVEGDEERWVRLIESPESTPNVLRIQIEAASTAGVVLADALNGLGSDIATKLDDALTQFCIGDFHVLLASLWGLLEEDQVDYRHAVTNNGLWDLYLGPWLSRMSNPAESIPPPEKEFAERLVNAASEILTERKPTTGRLFVASFKGDMTYEALVDGTPNAALEALLRALPLEHSVSEYASQRLFFVAIPRGAETAHRQVSRCSTSVRERVQAAPRSGRVLALTLAAAAVMIAAFLFFLLR